MFRHNKRTSQNFMQISISPVQMATRAEKTYRSVKMKEIISTICALFNSGGGKLELSYESKIPETAVDDCMRMIEQSIGGMVGMTTLTSRITFEVNPRRITLNITEASKLVSVNYNLYLRSERQVIAVPATEPAEEIKKIVQRKSISGKNVPIGSHLKRFVEGQNTGLRESVDVEKKSLKASSSKSVTLADRIVGKSNKLKSYISAFANHIGGHIYYGVSDEGTADGEKIAKKEKDQIIKKVTHTINKMIWPQSCGKPQIGRQWDIFFEPVEDASGNRIPSTFVIVIHIAPCLGGVFTEEPESYHVVKGKVEKLRFQDWWRNFIGISEHTELLSIPSHVSRVRWSSEKKRNLCRKLHERLVQHRSDEDMIAFNELSELAIKHFPESDAQLVVMVEKVVVAHQRYHFRKADILLQEFAKLLANSKDCSIFEVRMLLLRSMIEHSQGNYEVSYEIAQDGLQKMQLIPIDRITVELYIKAATVATIVLARTHELQKCLLLKDQARMHLQLAARDANSLTDLPSDLQQKLHIYKAWTLLECSDTGEVVRQEHGISLENIEAAASELAFVFESDLKRRPLTHFRKTQFFLAQCDLFRRRSELMQEDYTGNLKQAYECGSKARTLARKHHFELIVEYANERLADLTEKLVRHSVHTRGGHARHANPSFFGFQY